MIRKIAFIHHAGEIGGAPTSLRNLISVLREQTDWDINVFCVYDSIMPFFKEVDGIKVTKYVRTSDISGRFFIWTHWGLELVFKAIWEIFCAPRIIYQEWRYLWERDIDLIHLNSAVLWSTAIAAKLCGIPIVWHIRETGKFTVRRWLFGFFVRSIARHVICIGPEEFCQIGGHYSSNVSIVYNSLPHSFFEFDRDDSVQQIRRDFSLPEEKFVFLSLGGISLRKGTFELIRSLESLPPDVVLALAGAHESDFSMGKNSVLKGLIVRAENVLMRGGLKRNHSWCYFFNIREQYRKIGKARIFPVGVLTNVKKIISACDVLIFAATISHFGRPIYEAWARKKPVIAFDSEVVRQDITDGEDGILVKEHTPEALAQAIRSLKDNPELARQMGEKGYLKAVERFSPKNAEKVIAIYQKVFADQERVEK